MDFSPQIKDFVRKNIRSVWQLEVILFVKDLGKAATAYEVASALYLRPDAIEKSLLSFEKLGIVKSNEGSPRKFYYSPSSELSDQIEQTAKAYSERRFAIINLIFSSPVQSFSDAFRLAEEKD